MKKIGIITFHDVQSFGATLQCFALFRFLEKKGYCVKIIDYAINAYLEQRKKDPFSRAFRIIKYIVSLSKIKLKINSILIKRRQRKFEMLLDSRNEKFKKFRQENYHLTEKRYNRYSELRRNTPVFDVYICGSDQIWNPNFCDMDDSYFLSFAPLKTRIAYAPSFGTSSLPKKLTSIYKERLDSIPYLSVREESGAKIIAALTGRNVPVVIDPTFLLELDDWDKLIQKSDVILPDKYILTYFIGIDSQTKQMINLIKSKYRDYEIINLIFDESCCGPLDFLKMIKNACIVFTNSFHGIALSINMNVPFVCVKTLKDSLKGNGFARIDNLLRKFELSNRIYNKTIELDDSLRLLDYSNVNRLRKQWVDESESFLIDSINHCGS